MAASAHQDERFVHVAATEPSRLDPDRVAAMLSADRPWEGLASQLSPGVGLRRYATDLRLPLGRNVAPAVFRKAALLDLGTPERTEDGWRLEVGWQASSAAPLFPVFSGWLHVGSEELRIDGLYAPPGGVIGRVADRMLLHVAATGTAQWLLREINAAALRSVGG